MDAVNRLEDFLRDKYYTELAKSSMEEQAAVIDFSDLNRSDPLLADQLLEMPEIILKNLNEAAHNILDEKTNVRIKNLPASREIRIRNLRSKHIGKLTQIDTIIRAASEVKPQIYEAIYQCPTCSTNIVMPQETNLLQKPWMCECGYRGDFTLIEKKMYDIRWLVGVEPFELTTGERPGEISILLKEDLTTPRMQKKTDPGNKIKIVGILKELPKRIKGKLSTKMDTYIDAVNILPSEIEFEELDISEEDERRIKEFASDPGIYEKLTESIAPGIYGFDEIKEALVFQLFGGISHRLPDNTRIRGNIHILITGDPGCLVGDERVVLGNGAILKMQDFGKEHLQKIDVSILTGEGGKKRDKASVFHLYKKQPVLEIITESGKSIKGTYNHPLMCVGNDNGRLVRKWNRLDEMKIGDKLAVVTSIPCTITKHIETGFKCGERKYGPKFKGKLPKYVDENLAALMGYVLGDGWVDKYEVGFVVAEPEIDILEKLANISETLFSLRPKINKRQIKSGFIGERFINRKVSMTYSTINSKDIANSLNILRTKRVPDLILRSGNKVAASFLRWLYEADGCVFDKDRGNRSINLKSNKIELLRDVQILLLRFAIHSRIVGDNLMIRRGESMLKFAKHIGFVSEKKRTKLAQLAKSAEDFKHFKSQRTEKIVKIIKHPPEDVYDIEVPRSHRFIANGIISHNTGKSVLLKLVSSVVPRGRYVSGSGVTGAGLCTTYDTLIQLDNGSLVKIGDFVEHYANSLQKEQEGIYAAEINGHGVMSLAKDSLAIQPKRITHVWKLASPAKLIKLKTRSGKEIRVTKENPLPVIKNGELVWKFASSLQPGDFLATPRQINCSFQKMPVLDFIDKEAHLKNCGSTVLQLLDKIKSGTTIKDVADQTGVSKQGLYWFWKHEKAAPQIAALEKVAEKLNIDLLKLLPEQLILEQQRGHIIKVPKYFDKDVLYLFGLIAGDGDIQKTSYGGYAFRFHSADKELLDTFCTIAAGKFGVEPKLYKHPDRIECARLNSKILGKMAGKLGIPHSAKSGSIQISEKLSSLPDDLVAAYIQGLFDTDGYVVERNTKGSNGIGFTTVSRDCAYGVMMLLLRFGIHAHIRIRNPSVSFIRGREVRSKEKYEVEIRGKDNLIRFRDTIGFRLSRKKDKLERIIQKTSTVNTNIDIVPEIGNLLAETRKKIGMTAADIFGYKNYAFEKERIRISRIMLARIAARMKAYEKGKNSESEALLKKLEILAHSDIFWDEIIDTQEVAGEDFVYDLTVEDEHSFIANGLIIHNTATVVKNEAIGGWVLEAGALILCNKGMIAIDEFDKMSRDDQIAMHEATSIETVSIAKASIVATLPAQTAVLAAANPKFGRFDITRSIVEQIDIPETLLSRFDLKFALLDKPDKTVDEKLAEHIIISRRQPEKIEPIVSTGFLRKYIAYAKQINSLELTDEAAQLLKDFYVDMRNRYSTSETSVVSITLRQYEALLRLAEASAKIRLDNKILIEDANRAIKLMKFSLTQLGYDIETGQIDIDKLESGITASRRKKISGIIDIIATLGKETGKEVAIEDVMAEAESQGITNAEDIIEELKRQGTIFEPRAGFVRKL